jgi:hypothetical protein
MHSPVSPTVSPGRPDSTAPGPRLGHSPIRTGAAALVMLVGLAGCGYASSSGQAGAASSATAPNAPGASSAASSPAQPSAPAKTSAPGTPLNPGGQVDPPLAQAESVPAGAKLVVFEGVSRSGDGKTLYMADTTGGGACGQYDVVVQETSTTVELGLAHLPNAKNLPCPMFVRMVQFPANLATPVGDRQVVDMANGQVIGAGTAIKVVQADIAKLPGAQNGEPSQTARAFNPVTS